MLSLITFSNLAKILILLGFKEMQDTKCSLFTGHFKTTVYSHKSFLVAHPLLGQRVEQQFKGLATPIFSMPLAGHHKGKETSRNAFSMLPGTSWKELVAESDTGIFTPSRKMYNNSNLNPTPCLAQFLCPFLAFSSFSSLLQ